MSINNQKGFTMLEVLIAIIIFSFGLLGLAGLQLVSLANNLSANSRSTATALAYDMADRMRANMQGAVAENSTMRCSTPWTSSAALGRSYASSRLARSRQLPDRPGSRSRLSAVRWRRSKRS